MKKENKIFMLFILLLTLSISSVCYANETDNSSIDTIILNSNNCTIEVYESQNDDFKYDYDKKLFNLTTRREKNKLTITAKAIKDAEIKWYDKIFIFIPNNTTYKQINVENNNSAIYLCELDSELNIVNNKGATSFNIPKVLKHNIYYTSKNGCGSAYLFNETNNYTFNISQKHSAISLPFVDYDHLSKTFDYEKGNGKFQINMNIKNSSFAINTYTKEKTKTNITLKYKDTLEMHTPIIETTTLPAYLKDCKFYDIFEISENDSINSIIDSYIKGDSDKFDYAYTTINTDSYCKICNKSLLLLFNEDKQLLGYTTIPKVKSGIINVTFTKYTK